MTFVLDVSTTMAWCFEDEQTPLSERCLDLLVEDDALVPPLWRYEVANVLVVAERRRRLTAAAAAQFMALLGQLPITTADEDPELPVLVDVARRYELSAYDAAYLALAARHGLALATVDARLRDSAATAGVALVS